MCYGPDPVEDQGIQGLVGQLPRSAVEEIDFCVPRLRQLGDWTKDDGSEPERGVDLLQQCCLSSRWAWALCFRAVRDVSTLWSELEEALDSFERGVAEIEDVKQLLIGKLDNTSDEDASRAKKYLSSIFLRRTLLRLLRERGADKVYDRLLSEVRDTTPQEVSELTEWSWNGHVAGNPSLRGRVAVVARAYWGLSRDLRSLGAELAHEEGPFAKSVPEHVKIAYSALSYARKLAAQGSRVSNGQAGDEPVERALRERADFCAAIEDRILEKLESLSNGKSGSSEDYCAEKERFYDASEFVTRWDVTADQIGRQLADCLPKGWQRESRGSVENGLSLVTGFQPSDELIDAVRDSLACSPEEFLAAQMLEPSGDDETDRVFFSQVISSEVEALLTIEARDFAASTSKDQQRQAVWLSAGRRFTDSVAKLLAHCLYLSPWKDESVLELLQKELVSSLPDKGRRLAWGYVRTDGSDVYLEVDVGRSSGS